MPFKNRPWPLPLLLVWTVLVTVAWTAVPAETRTAQAAEPTGQELPPDHPPVESQTSRPGVLPPVPPGSGTGGTGLTWEDPEGWTPQRPSSSMRRAQYRVPGPGGDGECVVFYFGPGQGGNAQANALRWIQQFTQPDGRPSTDVASIDKREVSGREVVIVEVKGTYSGGMRMGGGGQSYPGYMLLGAIAQGPDANWFFKLTGPQATLEAQHKAFEGLIDSLKAGSAR